MLSLGAALAAVKSSVEIKRQLCCAPAVVEDRTWRVINISRLCLRTEESLRSLCCSPKLLSVYVGLYTCKCLQYWLPFHLFLVVSMCFVKVLPCIYQVQTTQMFFILPTLISRVLVIVLVSHFVTLYCKFWLFVSFMVLLNILSLFLWEP